MNHPQKIEHAALSGDHVSVVMTLAIWPILQTFKKVKPRIGLVARRGRTFYAVVAGCPNRDDIGSLMAYINELNSGR